MFPTGVLAFSGLPLNTFTSMGLTAPFLLACFLYDLRTRGHVHPAFLWGGISILAWTYATRELIKHSGLAVVCGLAYALTLVVPCGRPPPNEPLPVTSGAAIEVSVKRFGIRLLNRGGA